MSDTYVSVNRLDGLAMITLRADLSDKAVIKAVKTSTSMTIPAKTTAVMDGDSGLGWMSPDELIVLCPDHERSDTVAGLTKNLAALHALVTDVSDARAVFELKGDGVREVLAKLTPVDTHPDALPLNAMRRTRFGQVAGAFWFQNATTVRIVCFRSVGDYMDMMLRQSAQKGAQVFV
ncbi:MAG: sarcosine oxidase subunit gamma family protein [Pseudomonadota bacterium]